MYAGRRLVHATVAFLAPGRGAAAAAATETAAAGWRGALAAIGPTFVRRLSATCRNESDGTSNNNNNNRKQKQPFYVTFGKLDHSSAGCIATITMSNPRANTFDQDSLDALNKAVGLATAAEKDVRGLVLRSDVDGFFSSGFDLSVFQDITHAEFMRLWTASKAIFRRIHALPVPSVAAIDGHALGLGFVFAMACQLRCMVHPEPHERKKKPPLVGLNEVAVGLPVPEWLALRFRHLTTPRIAEDLLPTGAMLPADRALEAGLVDRLFPSSAAMHDAILADLSRRAMVPHEAQKQTIGLLRSEYLARFDACNERDNDFFWSAVSSPATQAAITSALARLKAKKPSR
ncbi:dodecenoyl-CoA isomerase [Coemansia sp. BCRC 34490]|nr:dodecenoyl-CoA isomerase [Coemansia sp. BCRC 34490]